MTTSHFYRPIRLLTVPAALAISTSATQSQADVILFDFTSEGISIDGVGLGGSLTSDGLTLTTIDIIDIDGNNTSDTGAVDLTNIGSNDALGINSASSTGDSVNNESQNFDDNEGWVFSFDFDVEIMEIDFESFSSNGGTRASFKSGIFPTFLILESAVDGSDVYEFSPNRFVAAGDEITIINTSPTGDNWRIEGITVEATVPEPSSMALVALGCFTCMRRRRH